MMSGPTVLESLSNSKLVVILATLLTIQVASFHIGAFLTPSPSSFEQFTSVHCSRQDRNQLAVPRHHKHHGVDVAKNCDRPGRVLYYDKASSRDDKFDMTTFAVQLPLPRDAMDLAYSRWMQTLLVLIIPDFNYEPSLASTSSSQQRQSMHDLHSHTTEGKTSDHLTLLIDVDLAVKNRDEHDWTLYASRRGLRRTIKFHDQDFKRSNKFDCEPIQLFELQSLHYNYYLINFELRDDDSIGAANKSTFQFPGQLTEITGVAIHHNGGFTQIWLLLKSIFFIATVATLAWYCNRLKLLHRKTILIERLLVGLGAALTQLNFPAELLSLYFEIPFMMFLNDLRQGVFYCVLLSFWIIFVGEHLLEGSRKDGSKLVAYARELIAISVASIALLIFDLSERGIQAIDPFVTIWESEPKLANLSITIACCACLAYLGFLLYYIYLAFNSISGKQCVLPKMQLTKRLKYQGVIYRFKFLLCFTTVCAVGTLIFYALSHRNDWSSYDDDTAPYSLPTIEWTSAMFTTVCAMWNLYVIVLMILYAPSHKGIHHNASPSDQIEFDCLTDYLEDEINDGDMKLMQEFANKRSIS